MNVFNVELKIYITCDACWGNINVRKRCYIVEIDTLIVGGHLVRLFRK